MSNTHCLIVDDSDVVRRVTRHMLGAIGIDASEAVNGLDALDRCSKAMPDVILLDWIMPVQGGLECLQALRRLPGGDSAAVIYCTSENDPVEFARALAAGATDILVKPFSREMLRLKLASAGVICDPRS